MELKNFIICDRVISDSETNQLSLIDIFYNFNISNFPGVQQRICIFIEFENKNPGLYEVELEFLDEKDSILKQKSKFEIGINGKGLFVKTFYNYLIPRCLDNQINVNYEGKTLGTRYLTVNKI